MFSQHPYLKDVNDLNSLSPEASHTSFFLSLVFSKLHHASCPIRDHHIISEKSKSFYTRPSLAATSSTSVNVNITPQQPLEAMSTSESGDGKLGKLKAKLKRLSEKIDAADQRTVDAKANIIEAIARLEKAECEVGSIERRTQLLGTDLKIATERGEELSTKLEKVVGESTEIEEARQALEANEAEGDEKISSLEEELRKARLTLEENQIKLIDMERKYVVVKSDMERGKTKADALEARVAQLEGSMADANTSLKELEVKEGASSEQEQKNAEAILVLDGQLKDAEVRAEAATRSCQVLEHNTQETQGIIDEYNEKIKQLESEIVQMNELAGEIESDEDE